MSDNKGSENGAKSCRCTAWPEQDVEAKQSDVQQARSNGGRSINGEGRRRVNRWQCRDAGSERNGANAAKGSYGIMKREREEVYMDLLFPKGTDGFPTCENTQTLKRIKELLIFYIK